MNFQGYLPNSPVALLILCSFWFLTIPCISQPATVKKLALSDEGLKIENKIKLQISDKEYQSLFKTNGKRLNLNTANVIVNDHSATVEELHTRGKTTLYMPRKSLSFDLGDKMSFHYNGDEVSMKKFYAISMSMDRNYIKNRLSFGMMGKLGLFQLFYTYCEIVINEKTNGIYLIIERPQDWALKSKDSPLIIRRGFNHEIEKIKTGKKVNKVTIKMYRNIYRDIYRNITKHKGEKLYQTISQLIDLEMYMQWLAFNYFVHNGDYTDEVYFYIDTKENRYKIIPWDYDDTFAREPHEGMSQKKFILGDKFIFSSEDELDQKIASDPYLYNKYLEQFRAVLLQLDPDFLQTVFKDTFAELYPYFSRDDILEISRKDTFKGASLESLEFDLDNIYTQLILTRSAYLNKLDKE